MSRASCWGPRQLGLLQQLLREGVELYVGITAEIQASRLSISSVEEAVQPAWIQGQVPTQNPHVQVIGGSVAEQISDHIVKVYQVGLGWDADVIELTLGPYRERGTHRVVPRTSAHQLKLRHQFAIGHSVTLSAHLHEVIIFANHRLDFISEARAFKQLDCLGNSLCSAQASPQS